MAACTVSHLLHQRPVAPAYVLPYLVEVGLLIIVAQHLLAEREGVRVVNAPVLVADEGEVLGEFAHLILQLYVSIISKYATFFMSPF